MLPKGTLVRHARDAHCLLLIQFFEYRRKNVVQGAAESPEGDGPAHQPDISLPAEPLTRPGLAVREREPANRGPHCRLRRVHEPGAGRRRGVSSEDEEQEAAWQNYAERRQHHADTKYQSNVELRSDNITSTRRRRFRRDARLRTRGLFYDFYENKNSQGGSSEVDSSLNVRNTNVSRECIDECINGDLYLFGYKFPLISMNAR